MFQMDINPWGSLSKARMRIHAYGLHTYFELPCVFFFSKHMWIESKCRGRPYENKFYVEKVKGPLVIYFMWIETSGFNYEGALVLAG